jgi:Co/Zn/Cd efflux system component
VIHLQIGNINIILINVISLIIICILVHDSYKLFIKAAKTVLEYTPSDIDIHSIRELLIEVEGMLVIHKLHI